MRPSARIAAGFAFLLFAASCASQKGDDTLKWREVGYGDVPGWSADYPQGEALAAYVASCKAPKASQHALQSLVDNRDWRSNCHKAEQALYNGDDAKRFFETHFTPYQLYTGSRETGMLTGYYIPVLNGSMTRSARYDVPVYKAPADIKTRRPNASREQILNGALANKGLELLWVDDAVMLFFMHIQGSGRVQLEDGRMMGLQYNQQNGHGYVAIGKVLVDMGEMQIEDVTLQSIRQWLYDNPKKAHYVMNQNPSYIFFTLNEAKEMAKGAMGIPLTGERSLAIDPSQVPYGLPVFVDTVAHNGTGDKPFQQLLITQDTGGAIKGPLRGDIFFGAGAHAERRAGGQKEQGRWYILIPNG